MLRELHFLAALAAGKMLVAVVMLLLLA